MKAARVAFDDGPQQSKTGPVPPAGVAEKVREPASLAGVEVVLSVPGYSWRHGCGPTAVGMVVGYYDILGYRGLIPGNAATQSSAVNEAISSGGDSSKPNPPGSEEHYEDYAVPQDYSPDLLTDDYISQGRAAHTDNCIADYMDTSKSTRNNYYGWSWSSDVGPSFLSYVNQQNSWYRPSYERYRMSSTLSWDVLTTEIDNGRPMVFLVDTDGNGGTDHFVTVVGYRSTPVQQYGCLDTWQPVDIVRWCDFEAMSGGQSWGIWGGWSFSLGSIPGDFDTDGDVDWRDMETFRGRWLDHCSAGDWCGGCDINQSTRVDCVDFAMLAEHWLAGLQPRLEEVR
ncbi:MAG: hypothetical protein ACYS4W_06335 [Planctomycetota bacterium]